MFWRVIWRMGIRNGVLALFILNQSQFSCTNNLVSQINKFKFKMDEDNNVFDTICVSTPISNHYCGDPDCSHPYLFSNSALESLISLKKAPFLVQQQQNMCKRINSPETTCEKIQQKIIHYNRKQKSLEQLSKKFLNQFEGRNIKFLELDKVTKTLNVEKRRIYDIINILESLKVVAKNGKNNYRWKGLTEAVQTIHQCQKDINSLQIQSIWKEKSLEFLASGLLKLFLHWKNVLSLEEAAKEIIKQIQGDTLRTKIRRLYDIINVFKSLQLVQKTTLPNRKPGFKWLGTHLLEEYIQKRQEGALDEEDSFDNFQLEVQQSIDRSKLVPVKPFSPQSYFIQILEKKVGFQNVQNVSNIFANQLWPQINQVERKGSQKELKEQVDKGDTIKKEEDIFPFQK